MQELQSNTNHSMITQIRPGAWLGVYLLGTASVQCIISCSLSMFFHWSSHTNEAQIESYIGSFHSSALWKTVLSISYGKRGMIISTHVRCLCLKRSWCPSDLVVTNLDIESKFVYDIISYLDLSTL